MKTKEWRCSNCNTIILDKNLLETQNPFDTSETIYGCPHCLSCSGTTSFEQICDEPGCYQAVSCGYPTDDGYRLVCGKHYRDRRDD